MLSPKINFAFAALALTPLTSAATHAAAFATTIADDGPVPPLPGPFDFFQVDASGALNRAQDFTDVPTPGQSFMVANNFRLIDLSLKGSGETGDGFQTGSFHLEISAVGSGNSLTPLATFTAPAAPIAAHASDYFTFSLASANLTLSAGTRYAFALYTDSGFFGLARSATATAAGGNAFNEPANRAFGSTFTLNSLPAYDRVFEVGLAPVPEFSSSVGLGVLLTIGGLALAVRKLRAKV